jgi:hypothetical protein
MAVPFGVGCRYGQQTSGDRSRDQQGFEAQHGLYSFISLDRGNPDLSRPRIWVSTMTGLRQHSATLVISW